MTLVSCHWFGFLQTYVLISTKLGQISTILIVILLSNNIGSGF